MSFLRYSLSFMSYKGVNVLDLFIHTPSYWELHPAWFSLFAQPFTFTSPGGNALETVGFSKGDAGYVTTRGTPEGLLFTIKQQYVARLLQTQCGQELSSAARAPVLGLRRYARLYLRHPVTCRSGGRHLRAQSG